MDLAISVVIPSYNDLTYLPHALASVWQQTSPANEVWVVDDGSNDGTIAYLQQQQWHHPNLHYLRLEHAGVAAARNAAMQLCRHPWVAFLDADDRWYPTKLACQRQHLARHPNTHLLFSNYRHRTPEGNSLGDCFHFWPHFRRHFAQGEHQLSRAILLAQNVVGTSAAIVARQATLDVGGFDPQLASASDWDLWLKLAATGPIWSHSDLLMDYLCRPNSISSHKLKRLQAMVQIIHRHSEQQPRQTQRYARANLARAFSEYYASEQQPWNALWQQWQSWYLAPNWDDGKRCLAQWRACWPSRSP